MRTNAVNFVSKMIGKRGDIEYGIKNRNTEESWWLHRLYSNFYLETYSNCLHEHD